MTAEKLKEIEDRAAKALAGPWRKSGYDIVAPKAKTFFEDSLAIVVGNPEHLFEDDQDFIVASRTDVPELVAEVRQLNEALANLLKFAEELCADIKVSKHYPSMDKARAVLEGK